MHRLHIRRQRHGKPQRLLRSRIPAVHRNNHNRRRQFFRTSGRITQCQLFPHSFVMSPHSPHEEQRRRQQQHHHPRPLGKLGHHHHHNLEPRSHSPQPSDRPPVYRRDPYRRPPPVPDHPRLRQGESQKCAYRE